LSRVSRHIFCAVCIALGVLGCEIGIGGNSPERLLWTDHLVITGTRVTVSSDNLPEKYIAEALSKQGLSIEPASPPTSEHAGGAPHLHFYYKEERPGEFNAHFLLTAFTATAVPGWWTPSVVLTLEVTEPGTEPVVREIRDSYFHVLWAPLAVWALPQALLRGDEWDESPFEFFLEEMVANVVEGMETR